MDATFDEDQPWRHFARQATTTENSYGAALIIAGVVFSLTFLRILGSRVAKLKVRRKLKNPATPLSSNWRVKKMSTELRRDWMWTAFAIIKSGHWKCMVTIPCNLLAGILWDTLSLIPQLNPVKDFVAVSLKQREIKRLGKMLEEYKRLRKESLKYMENSGQGDY